MLRLRVDCTDISPGHQTSRPDLQAGLVHGAFNQVLASALVLILLTQSCQASMGQSPATTSGANASSAPGPASLPTNYRERLKDFKPFELPPEPTSDHNVNKTLDLGPIRQSTLVPFSNSKTIRLEASYNEPMSLREALYYLVRNSLPIKVAKESDIYQRFQYYNQLTDVLPNFTMGYTLTNSDIRPNTTSFSRVFQPTVRYPVFTGGNVLYTALAQYYRQKGWHEAYKVSINDALLDVYLKYTNLVLNNALMQVRAKSLAISQSQLELNNTLYKSGNGTQFAIMQSRTQLAADRQALLTQQVAVRQAAMALAFALNFPMAVNLVPRDELITEQSIIDHNVAIEDLLDLALKNRPDLRQYEFYRVAAARNVPVAASPMYPQASFFTSYTHSTTNIFPGHAATSSGSGSVAGAGVFGGLFNTYQQGFAISMSLPNLGATYVFNIVSARALSRQAELQANQELLLVTEQVRAAYLTAITAREQIDTAAYGVASAAEALRLANLRLQTGLGSNLELIQAQRDYVTALTNQAQAIVISNQAQAQLLHDMGLISAETLVDGYRPIKGRLR
jgi:outer membrane protein TolC